LNYCALYRGVTPVKFNSTTTDSAEFINNALQTLKDAEYLQNGDLILLTHGDDINEGSTNTCKIIHI
ncbi:MAG: pyruvate kinase, partial [Psychromonas sp.]|nr:pyruvate kinase [Psychromonas sp.]